MENLLLNNQIPIYILISLYIFLMLYKDILKPFFDKRSTQLIEIEKENKLIKKHNQEAAWQEKVIDILTNKDKNRLSAETLRVFIINSFTVSGLYLQREITEIIKRNDIKNPVRQKQIESQLQSFLTYEKDRVRAMLDNVYFYDLKVSEYFNTISPDHTENFILHLTENLFSETETEKKRTDLENLIDFHYKTHINDCLKFAQNNG